MHGRQFLTALLFGAIASLAMAGNASAWEGAFLNSGNTLNDAAHPGTKHIFGTANYRAVTAEPSATDPAADRITLTLYEPGTNPAKLSTSGNEYDLYLTDKDDRLIAYSVGAPTESRVIRTPALASANSGTIT